MGDRLDVPAGTEPDEVYVLVAEWAEKQGLELYPHQEEAILELLSGNHLVLATPTGSGKSLVALAAHAAALARDEVSFYTAPIKALVSEKFFALCGIFGSENVGMLTGDASVNPDAPIICCTAEVLANVALREGAEADVGVVVMDEFHFYGDPQRGWAWQVPLLELPGVRFLLMSATLGDTTALREDLSRRTERDTALVDDAARPVPLTFTWQVTPLQETLEELVEIGQAPVYVVHFTQKDAVSHATSLLGAGLDKKLKERIDTEALAERLAGVRFGAGFGRTLNKLLRKGIGVHHAGMLPRYRRLVEQLAQVGLLTVICGTDTLGVGINVPIRTVLFTGLAKFDGSRQRVLRNREFAQIAGRAGRAGFDTIGYVVVQAPEHVIENEKAKAKAAARQAAGKKRSKAQLKKPAPGTVVWTEDTFTRLVEGEPEPMQSRMRVDNAMLLHVVSRPEDAFPVLRRLLKDNHEPRREQLRLARRALRLASSLVASGVLTRLEELDEHGRRYVLTEALPEDFALNQPLAHFALEVLDLLDADAVGPEEYALDVVSVVEAVLEGPRQILFAQQREVRGERIAELKAEGVDYEERMAIVDELSWPEPLTEFLQPLFETYQESHPWIPDDALEPKSVVRQMYEEGMGFTDFIGRYQLARAEGLLLRYLTDAYKTLVRTVPDRVRSPELTLLTDWLGETVRQVDSSLLDEWEALNDPDHAPADVTEHAPPPPPRPLSAQDRVLRVMVRNAMWRRVELVARDDVDGLAGLERAAADLTDPPGRVTMDAGAWDAALEEYYDEHDSVLLDADARGPDLHRVVVDGRRWRVTQTLHDPQGYHDWVIEAEVDLDATDTVGEPVLVISGMRRLGP